MNPATIASAMNVLAACVSDAEIMRRVAVFYLSRYPESAEYAMAIPAVTVRINVPPNVHMDCTPFSVDVPRAQAENWLKIYRTPTDNSSSTKVQAVKQIRDDTGLGLKQCKELMEYLVSDKFSGFLYSPLAI